MAAQVPADRGGRKMNPIGPIVVLLLGALSTPALAETIHGTLYKDQHCECCEAHAEYLRKNGFDMKIETVKNLAEMSSEAGCLQGSRAVISSRSMATSSKATSR